jgi:hypothetical protein
VSLVMPNADTSYTTVDRIVAESGFDTHSIRN